MLDLRSEVKVGCSASPGVCVASEIEVQTLQQVSISCLYQGMRARGVALLML
ncbi:hypothetical protein BSLA_01r4988 [Burkholderia stabilis]|nr:hypothetical protein BSLA_01r4988 [Burkholderia stabilis]